MIRISAILAVAFGLALAVLEVARNWGHWEWWPFWVVDYVAAALLVTGGVGALRRGGSSWLTGGWGFTCAMFWMSFFGHYEGLMKAASPDPHEQRLTLIIGLMFVLTIIGLALGLGGSRRS